MHEALKAYRDSLGKYRPAMPRALEASLPGRPMPEEGASAASSLSDAARSRYLFPYGHVTWHCLSCMAPTLHWVPASGSRLTPRTSLYTLPSMNCTTELRTPDKLLQSLHGSVQLAFAVRDRDLAAPDLWPLCRDVGFVCRACRVQLAEWPW